MTKEEIYESMKKAVQSRTDIEPVGLSYKDFYINPGYTYVDDDWVFRINTYSDSICEELREAIKGRTYQSIDAVIEEIEAIIRINEEYVRQVKDAKETILQSLLAETEIKAA